MGRRQFRIVLLLMLAAFAALRFGGTIRYAPHDAVPQGHEATKVAYSLYKNGEWANPYAVRNTGPTAHEAPLFPALLSALYKTFGEGGGGLLAVQLSEALVLTTQIVLVALLGSWFGYGLEEGGIAAICLILGLENSNYWEQNYVGLLLIAASLLAYRLLRIMDRRVSEHDEAPVRWILPLRSPMALSSALGVLWGTLLLVSPATAFVWLSWVALVGWCGRQGEKRAWLALLFIPLLMLLPWTWRNYRVFHRFVPVRSNLGIELDVSNNPCASFAYRENALNGCFDSRHPYHNLAEAEKVVQLGEASYNRAKLRQTLAWMVANPRRFARLTLQRFFYFWFPTDTGKFSNALFGYFRDQGPVQAWVVYPATLLSIPGLVLLWRRMRAAALICASILIFFPLIYYLVQFDYRYRLPILWVTFFLGAIAARQGARLAMAYLKAGAPVRWPPSKLAVSAPIPGSRCNSERRGTPRI